MSGILRKWLAEDVRVTSALGDLSRDCANGFLVGQVLFHTNQITEAEWAAFQDSDRVDAHIKNYTALWAPLHRLGVKLDVARAQRLVHGSSNEAASLLYELKSSLATVQNVVVGRGAPSKQKLIQLQARSADPAWVAQQVAAFERGLRAVAPNQNDLLLRKAQRGLGASVVQLGQQREATHQARLQAHRQMLLKLREQRLQALRSSHLAAVADAEAGIREWQRNQELRQAERVAHATWRAKQRAKATAKVDDTHERAVADMADGIAQFEARALDMGVNTRRPGLGSSQVQADSDSIARADVAAYATQGAAPSTLSGNAALDVARRAEFYGSLTRKLAADLEEQSGADSILSRLRRRKAGNTASGTQRARRRRAFLMANGKHRAREHAAQRLSQLGTLVSHPCAAEVQLTDAVTRIRLHELVFRRNRAARDRFIAAAARADDAASLARQSAMLELARVEVQDDCAQALAVVEATHAQRAGHAHQQATQLARAVALDIVAAACAAIVERHGEAEPFAVGSGAPLAGEPAAALAAVQRAIVQAAFVAPGPAEERQGSAVPLLAVSASEVPLALAADGAPAKGKGKGAKGTGTPAASAEGDGMPVQAPEVAAQAAAAACRAEQEACAGSLAAAHALGSVGISPARDTAAPMPNLQVAVAAGNVQWLAKVATAAAQAAASLPAPLAAVEAVEEAAVDACAALEALQAAGNKAGLHPELSLTQLGEGVQPADREALALERIRARSQQGRRVLAAVNGEAGALEQVAAAGAAGQQAAQPGDMASPGAPPPAGVSDAALSARLVGMYLAKALPFASSEDAQAVLQSWAEESAAASTAAAVEDEASSGKGSKKSMSEDVPGISAWLRAPVPDVPGIEQAPKAQHFVRSMLDELSAAARRSTAALPPIRSLPPLALPPAPCDVPTFGLTVAVVGPPGSGRTTLARRLAHAHQLAYLCPADLVATALALARGTLAVEQCTLPAAHAHALRAVGEGVLLDAKRAQAAQGGIAAVMDWHLTLAAITAVRALAGAPVDPALRDRVPAEALQQCGDAAPVPRGWVMDGFPHSPGAAALFTEALTWQEFPLPGAAQDAPPLRGRGTWLACAQAAAADTGEGGAAAAEQAESKHEAPDLPAGVAVAADAAAQAAANQAQSAEWTAALFPPAPSPAHAGSGHAFPGPSATPEQAVPAPCWQHGIDVVLSLELPDDTLLRRMLGVRLRAGRLVNAYAGPSADADGSPEDAEAALALAGAVASAPQGLDAEWSVDSTAAAGPGAAHDDQGVALPPSGVLGAAEQDMGFRVPAVDSPTAHEGWDGDDVVLHSPGGVLGQAGREQEPQPCHDGALAAGVAEGAPCCPDVPASPADSRPEDMVGASLHDHIAELPSAVLDASAVQTGLEDGLTVQARQGLIRFHLDTCPPPADFRHVHELAAPYVLASAVTGEVPGQEHTDLSQDCAPAGVHSSSALLTPVQLGEALAYWRAGADRMLAWLAAGGKNIVLHVPLWRHAGAQVHAAGGGVYSLPPEAAHVYEALSEWAQDCGMHTLHIADVLRVCSALVTKAEQQRAAAQEARAAEWAAVQASRAAAVQGIARHWLLGAAQRRAHGVAAATLIEEQAAAAAQAAAAQAAGPAQDSGKQDGGDAQPGSSKHKDAEQGTASESKEAGADRAASPEPAVDVHARGLVVPALHARASPWPDATVPLPQVPAHVQAVLDADAAEAGPASAGADAAASDSKTQQDDVAEPCASVTVMLHPARALEMRALTDLAVARWGTAVHGGMAGLVAELRAASRWLAAPAATALSVVNREIPGLTELMRGVQNAINSPDYAARAGAALLGPLEAETAQQRLQHAEQLVALACSQALAVAAPASSKKGSKKGSAQSPRSDADGAAAQPSEAELAAASAVLTQRRLHTVVNAAAAAAEAVIDAREEQALACVQGSVYSSWLSRASAAVHARAAAVVWAELELFLLLRWLATAFYHCADAVQATAAEQAAGARLSTPADEHHVPADEAVLVDIALQDAAQGQRGADAREATPSASKAKGRKGAAEPEDPRLAQLLELARSADQMLGQPVLTAYAALQAQPADAALPDMLQLLGRCLAPAPAMHGAPSEVAAACVLPLRPAADLWAQVPDLLPAVACPWSAGDSSAVHTAVWHDAAPGNACKLLYDVLPQLGMSVEGLQARGEQGTAEPVSKQADGSDDAAPAAATSCSLDVALEVPVPQAAAHILRGGAPWLEAMQAGASEKYVSRMTALLTGVPESSLPRLAGSLVDAEQAGASLPVGAAQLGEASTLASAAAAAEDVAQIEPVVAQAQAIQACMVALSCAHAAQGMPDHALQLLDQAALACARASTLKSLLLAKADALGAAEQASGTKKKAGGKGGKAGKDAAGPSEQVAAFLRQSRAARDHAHVQAEHTDAPLRDATMAARAAERAALAALAGAAATAEQQRQRRIAQDEAEWRARIDEATAAVEAAVAEAAAMEASADKGKGKARRGPPKAAKGKKPAEPASSLPAPDPQALFAEPGLAAGVGHLAAAMAGRVAYVHAMVRASLDALQAAADTAAERGRAAVKAVAARDRVVVARFAQLARSAIEQGVRLPFAVRVQRAVAGSGLDVKLLRAQGDAVSFPPAVAWVAPDFTRRVLLPPASIPHLPALWTDADPAGAIPDPAGLLAFARRLKSAALHSAVGKRAFTARAYQPDLAALWSMPPPMQEEQQQAAPGGPAEPAPQRSTSPAKGSGKPAAKSKPGKGKAATAEDERVPQAREIIQQARARVASSEAALLDEEVIPAGTLLTVADFIGAVRQSVQAGELPRAWAAASDAKLAKLALSFSTHLEDWGRWHVVPEQEPDDVLEARRAYAKWQAAVIRKRLLAEREAQRAAELAEAARLGVTVQEVRAQLDDDTAGSVVAAPAEPALLAQGVLTTPGSLPHGSPLALDQLSSLVQSAHAGSVAEAGSVASCALDEGRLGASEGGQLAAGQASIAAEPLEEEDHVITPEQWRDAAMRLAPGPADWPYVDPDCITRRVRAVLWHPLTHWQAPLQLRPQDVLRICEEAEPRAPVPRSNLAATVQPCSAASLSDAMDCDEADAWRGGDAEERLGVVAGAWSSAGMLCGAEPRVNSFANLVWVDWRPQYQLPDDLVEMLQDAAQAESGPESASRPASAGSSQRPGSASSRPAEEGAARLSAAQQAQLAAAARAAGLRDVYPPVDFVRLVDWRALISWMVVTGPAPSIADAAVSSLLPGPAEGLAGTGSAEAKTGIASAAEFALPYLRDMAPAKGAAWGIARWPSASEVDALAVAFSQLEQEQRGSVATPHGSGPARAQDEGAEEQQAADEGKFESKEEQYAGELSPAAPAAALPPPPGHVRVLPVSASPVSAVVQPAHADAGAEEAAAAAAGGKGKGKGKAGASKGKAMEAEEAAPADPLHELTKEPPAYLDPAAEAAPLALSSLAYMSELPLWWLHLNLGSRARPEDLRKEGDRLCAPLVDARTHLLECMDAAGWSARRGSSPAQSWHHVSSSHAKGTELLAEQQAVWAEQLQHLAVAQRAAYIATAARDEAASVAAGDALMAAVLFDVCADLRGNFNWRRFVQVLDRHQQVASLVQDVSLHAAAQASAGNAEEPPGQAPHLLPADSLSLPAAASAVGSAATSVLGAEETGLDEEEHGQAALPDDIQALLQAVHGVSLISPAAPREAAFVEAAAQEEAQWPRASDGDEVSHVLSDLYGWMARAQ